MSEVSKIGILLTFLFSFFSLALFAEILYLLFFRRPSSSTSAGKPTTFLPISLCRKTHHSGRVEPSSTPATSGHPAAAAPPPPSDEAKLEMAELLKLQNSRLLYTIKEEEREGSVDWSSERSTSLGDHRRRTLDSPRKCTAAAEEEVGHESVCSDQTTPFATPCASPSYYYSPSPSPERETSCVAGGGGKRWSPEI